MNKEKFIILECPNCHETIEKIIFSEIRAEEWSWNGENWECTFNQSLTDTPEKSVKCSECNEIIGKGTDFGF